MVKVLIQCDFTVENPAKNIKCLRIIAGYLELDNKSNDVLMVVYGYGGGGIQESRTYKITKQGKKDSEIYSGYIFSDNWERKYIDEEEYKSAEFLSSEESEAFEKFLSELDKWVIPASSFDDSDSENSDYYFNLSLNNKLKKIDSNANLFKSAKFPINYIKQLQVFDWPFITNW
jgi:hypothetical protein